MTVEHSGPQPSADLERIQPTIKKAAGEDASLNLESINGTREYYALCLRALELAVERVKEACTGNDIDAASIEAHFALHAVYDLHEAYFQPRRIHGWAAQDKILSTTGGHAVGALSLARGKRTHELLTILQTGGFSDQPHGMGPYGPGWIWKDHSWSGSKLRQRAAWYQNRVSRRILWAPLEEAWMWFFAQYPENSRPGSTASSFTTPPSPPGFGKIGF